MHFLGRSQELAYRFVYLIGPEGSGKSTQTRRLKKWHMSQGHEVKVVEIRTEHLAIYLLQKMFIKMGFANENSWKAKKGFMKNWSDPLIWKKIYPLILFFEVINTFLLAFIQVLVPMALGYVIIAESYVIDTCNDIQRRCRKFGIKEIVSKRITEILLKLMPDSTLLVFLDCGTDKLRYRYKHRQTHIEPPDYINLRRKQILQLAAFYKPVYINTGHETKAETFQKILRNLVKT